MQPQKITSMSPEMRRAAYRLLWLQLVGGWLGTDVILFFVYQYLLSPVSLTEPGQALIYTLQWQMLPLAVMLAMVYTVIIKRGLHLETALYPLETSASMQDKPLNTHNAVLRNSVEQWVIFLPLLLICSTLLTDKQHAMDMRLVPLLSVTFVAGRLVYWVGYVRAARYRVLGMAMTLHLSLYMLIYALIYGAS